MRVLWEARAALDWKVAQTLPKWRSRTRKIRLAGKDLGTFLMFLDPLPQYAFSYFITGMCAFLLKGRVCLSVCLTVQL